MEWRLWPGTCQTLAVLWFAGFGWYYYHQPGYAPLWSVWPSLIPRLWDMEPAAIGRLFKLFACLLWLIGLGWGLGRSLLRRWGLDSGEALGMFLFSLSLGWGLMALGMLGLGLLKLWNLYFVMACLAAATAAVAVQHGPGLRAARFAAPVKGFGTPWNALWVLIIALFAAFNLLGALMPEIFYDALAYHLALPDLYWKNGGLIPTPQNLYSGLPMLIEMLYALALPLGGDGLAHLIHWALGLGAAAWIYCLGRRFLGQDAGILSALLFYAIPLAGVISWKAAVELGWAFFEMAALYALSLRLSVEPADRRWTLLAGLLAGMAMGIKYQAWPMIAILTAVLAWELPGAKERAGESAAFLGVSLCALAPWPLKNVVLYRNPVYPFFHEYISLGPIPRWRDLLLDGGSRDIKSVLTTWSGLKSYLGHPWALTFQNSDLNSMGPLLLLGLPLLLLCRYRPRPLHALWLSLAGLWAASSLGSTLSRFLLPQAPLACLLMGAAFESCLNRRLKTLLRLGLLFAVCSNGFFLTTWLRTYGAEPVVLGRQTAREYLRSPHPSYARPAYAAIEFINERLPAKARVFLLAEARGFYCRRDFVGTTRFDEYPLQEWLRRSRDARELRELFRKEGITHVLVNRNELSVWQSGPHPFLPAGSREEKLLAEFTRKYFRPLFEDKAPAREDFSSPWTAVCELAD